MPPRRRRAAPMARAVEPRGGRPAGSRVLIDGRNVQHALARADAGASGSPLPTTSLIARLRAAFPPPTQVELILDGHPGGSVSGRIAPSFTVTYSRHATADEVIGDRVAEALSVLGPAGAWSVVVVSDDREVRDHARRNGARVESAAWLAGRLAAPTGQPARAGTAIGQGRPPRSR
jgi:YacP-like NYN domain